MEARKSSLMKQSDKMFKLFSRPNISIDDMRKFDAVEAYINDNNLDLNRSEKSEII